MSVVIVFICHIFFQRPNGYVCKVVRKLYNAGRENRRKPAFDNNRMSQLCYECAFFLNIHEIFLRFNNTRSKYDTRKKTNLIF